MEETGISVDVSLRGTRRSLPPAVDVAAYRVLQESLTNVVKHSSHPRADIEISYLPKALAVTVTNPDRPGAAPVEGIGLTGMRRRVTDVGGRLVVESNRPAGRFEVRATFPTGP